MSMSEAELAPVVDACRSSLAQQLNGGLWITAFPILAGSEALAKELLSLGAERVLAVGVSPGVRSTEHMSDQDERLERLCLNLKVEGDEMSEIRSAEALLDHLTPEHLAVIDRFDPEGLALAVRTIFSSSDTFAGRRVFGARRPEWMALEDKLIIDELWDEVGVNRSPSFNVSLNLTELIEASERLDRGDGVVVAGDNKSGFHGGATRTRWAQTPKQLNKIAKELGRECDRARVMPFLKGTPCSIHGWVFEGAEISLRPCEMLVSQEQDTYFDYHGAAVHWLPTEAVHAQMTSAAERVARHLKERYDYRGVFTIDGVADEERFYPTELNPRFGGAIARMSSSMPNLPLLLMHYATIEGGLTELDHGALREVILKAAATRSSIRPMIKLTTPCPEQRSAHFILRNERWVTCDEDTEEASEVRWGPAGKGSRLLATLDQRVFPDGGSTLQGCLELMKVAEAYFTPDVTPATQAQAALTSDARSKDVASEEDKGAEGEGAEGEGAEGEGAEGEGAQPYEVRKPKVITFS